MHRYAQTLFGNCTKENLLAGSPYEGIPVCFLIRVKGACNDGNSKIWPDLFDVNTQHGPPSSVELVVSTAQLRDNNRFWIWLEDM